ncbi:Phosphatidylglycerophosphatase and protein-tyrosine phosphatase 1, partial [Blomia tropicalis]
MFARATFIPTLAYNLLRNRWTSWNWYDRIDETVVLGALPFHGPVTQKLIIEENVRGVISMNEDFELRYVVSNSEKWKRFEISFLQLNTPDILHSPKQDKLDKGVEFIMKHIQSPKPPFTEKQIAELRRLIYLDESFQIPWTIQNQGKEISLSNCSQITPRGQSIYVHCKAGRTRSATLVACYLIKRYGLTPEEAIRLMTMRRRQIFLHTKQKDAIETFYKRNMKTKSVGKH